MSKRVLIVEDDKAIARVLRDNLQYEGFAVDWSETGGDVLQRIQQRPPDLILLDLMLPQGVDGFELCRSLAQTKAHIPVIIMSARNRREDRVRGLTLGADDYIVKPFALDELLARIKAVLRRAKPRVEHLKLGETSIDFRLLRAVKGKQELVLTDREFEILRHLAERGGDVVSREELLRLVWGYSDVPTTRTVDNFIFRLRRKIERDAHHPQYIRTAYGDGYRLTTEDVPESA
jgi:DNA-binding response OmpR family regulator